MLHSTLHRNAITTPLAKTPWVLSGLAALCLVDIARASDLEGGGLARMYLEYSRGNGPSADTASAGLGVRGLLGTEWLAYYGGLDNRFGASFEGGFAYEARLLALGLGSRISRTLLVATGWGVGVSGVTSRVRFGVPLPLELLVTVDLGEALQLGARAEATWIRGEQSRVHGADLLPFSDEQRFEVWIRVGDSEERRRWDWSSGYFLGAVYTEMLGERMMGAMLGHSLEGFYCGS